MLIHRLLQNVKASISVQKCWEKSMVRFSISQIVEMHLWIRMEIKSDCLLLELFSFHVLRNEKIV